MPNDDGVIEVVSVVEGSPADSAGIRKGDLLLTVDGKVYAGAQLTEAVEAARGEAGTKVVIGISRGGKAKDYTITRSVFVTPTVEHEIITADSGDGSGSRKSIGFIRVSSFNDKTAEDFELALNDVTKNNVKGLVIDVRNNAGGLVDQAVKMNDMLLDKGVICYAEDGKGEKTPYETQDGKITELPSAVLIDGTSVSAAEIFALGVKANGGGKLVGQTTYGKGLIQKLERFDAGDGARITIMQYVTPDGAPVNGIGITPDIEEVQPEGAEVGTATDAQLQRAIGVWGG
jgi:carboxyl-terminal processing protease